MTAEFFMASLLIIGGFLIFFARELAEATLSQKPSETPPPLLTPESDRREYPVTINIEKLQIQQLIIADVERPFVASSVQAEVQSRVETATRRWIIAFQTSDKPFDAGCYIELAQYVGNQVRSLRFTVLEVIVVNLPPIPRPKKDKKPDEKLAIALDEVLDGLRMQAKDPNRAERLDGDVS